jgi:hypothetical protein
MIEPSYSFVPRYLSGESAWIGHIPFAYDLVRVLRPSLLVELGTWSGDSFFAFCQSVADFSLNTRCYAVDHWRGDDQAGQSPAAQFARVRAYCAANYPVFAYLMRTDFASASCEFNDQTIDLLHIDGAHTYEAVSGDFAGWFPKVRPGGVILFHDICVRSSENHPHFGVWKFWDDLKPKHLTFEFRHAHGLGILLKGENPEVETWLRTATETPLGAYYAQRGTDLVAITAGAKLSASERNALRDRIAALEKEVEHLKITRFEAKRECNDMKTSLSWRLTWPLRVLGEKGCSAFLNRFSSRTRLL